MSIMQIDLPSSLLQRVQREIVAGENVNEVIVEAIQLWLENRREKKVAKNNLVLALREKGLVMQTGDQRALADSLRHKLRLTSLPDPIKVRQALSKVGVPLSEEIIAMRGE